MSGTPKRGLAEALRAPAARQSESSPKPLPAVQMRSLIHGLALLTGVDPAAAQASYDGGGPLARILASLFGAESRGRGRPKVGSRCLDFAAVESAKRDGFTGDRLWAEASRRANRTVEPATMKRYYEKAQAEIRQRPIAWFFEGPAG